MDESEWKTVETLLAEQSAVLARRQVPPAALATVRWRLQSGRWQRPHPGVVVAHSGALTREQRQWLAVLAAPNGAALRGATAAEQAGLKDFYRDTIFVALPGRSAGPRVDGVRYSRSRYLDDDLLADMKPPRMSLPAALIEMAGAAKAPIAVHAVLTAAAQQRLIRTDDLREVLSRRPNLRHRGAIEETLVDIDDGAQSFNEVAMLALCTRFGLPRPILQIVAATAMRRARIDGGWPALGVYFEIDGAGHFAAAKWAADTDRHNEVVIGTPPGSVHLRWPGFVVRREPERVADQARRAFEQAAGQVDAGIPRSSVAEVS